MVAESTRRIAGSGFEFQSLPPTPALKGLDSPGPSFRLLRETEAGDGVRDPSLRLTPFVGREAESAVISRHWTAACTGHLRVVVVSGEPGIGKSRLLREFRRSLMAQQHAVIECRCTPEHANSAFHALIEVLRRLMQVRNADPVEVSLAKIRDSVPASLSVDDAALLIAELLSISAAPGQPKLRYTPERQRQLTLDVLVAWFKHAAEKTPVGLMIEDIHWIDPSTLEFVNRLIAEAANLPLLVLITVRSETEPKWEPAFACVELELKGLPPESARALIIGASGEWRLPSEIVRMLGAKGDGIPLFLEESTRMAVDLRLDAETTETPGSRFTVPASIHDLLMARLDRLGPAKRVAQLGATLGREFSRALLEAVLKHPTFPLRIDDVAGSLRVLVDSGLLIAMGEAANVCYLFKHALVRDTAYQSLWERDRSKLHEAIALVMIEQFKPLTEAQPELMAFHLGEAGMNTGALQYWERAARRATSRSAHDEAISHLTSGLAMIARVPAGPERDRTELQLQLLLAGRLIATRGYGASRVEQVYARASELCGQLADDISLMKVHLGLEGYHFMRADFERAHAIAEEAGVMAARSANPMHRLQLSWASANLLFHQGEIQAAVARMDACLIEYERLEHRPGAVQDPGVMCLCYSAWGMWE
ncbi:MAG: AAA family ATPase, partial [Pseudomonadota bacterium]|nr:AAA family ATPase [Pseudomonadota bacterium]